MSVHPLLAIAAKDLRQRFRDRSAIVVGFIAPLAISALMSLAFSSASEYHADIGLVDLDGGELADALTEALAAGGISDIVTVVPGRDVPSVEAAIRDGDVTAALVVPEGFSDAVRSGSVVPPIEVLSSVDFLIDGRIASAIAEGFVAYVNATRLSVVATIGAGVAADPLLLAEEAGARELVEQVEQASTSAQQLDPVTYFGPGMGIFFLLFAVGFGAKSFFAERSGGTLARMAAAPISSRTVLAGKVLSVAVYGMLSLLTMWAFTSWVFGADWGHPLAVLLVCSAMVASVVVLTALVTVVARSERQADGMAATLAFVLALAGGNFVFISAAPPLLRRLATITPNGWALRAFTDMGTTAGGWRHDLDLVVTPLLGIAAFILVTLAVVVPLARRLVLS